MKKHELVFASDRILEKIDRVSSDIAERVERTLSAACPSMDGCSVRVADQEDGEGCVIVDITDYVTNDEACFDGDCECRDNPVIETDHLLWNVHPDPWSQTRVIGNTFLAYGFGALNFPVEQLGEDYPRDLLPLWARAYVATEPEGVVWEWEDEPEEEIVLLDGTTIREVPFQVTFYNEQGETYLPSVLWEMTRYTTMEDLFGPPQFNERNQSD